MSTRNGKLVSPCRLVANRQNAQKSTGPRTPAGKAVSRMNAVKHGILSHQVLVRGLHLKENRREFAALHQRFMDELNPVGPVEEMLVDQIVTTHWRLRRALRAEAGEIALSVDMGHWTRSRDDGRLSWRPFAKGGDPVTKLANSSLGNLLLADFLCDVRKQVEQVGELTAAAIRSLFGGQPNTLAIGLEKLRLRLSQNPDGMDAVTHRAENIKQVLAYIEREVCKLEERKDECK